MAEIITDGSQKELKKHGSDEFPLLVSYEKLSGYKSGSFLWHWHPEIEITLSPETVLFLLPCTSLWVVRPVRVYGSTPMC